MKTALKKIEVYTHEVDKKLSGIIQKRDSKEWETDILLIANLADMPSSSIALLKKVRKEKDYTDWIYKLAYYSYISHLSYEQKYLKVIDEYFKKNQKEDFYVDGYFYILSNVIVEYSRKLLDLYGKLLYNTQTKIMCQFDYLVKRFEIHLKHVYGKSFLLDEKTGNCCIVIQENPFISSPEELSVLFTHLKKGENDV